MLEALGWKHYLPQQTTSGKGRREVPNNLLFADEEHKQRALKEKKDDRRYRHGLVIVESKRWQRALDRGEETEGLDPGTPSNQILRYLTQAEIASDKAIQWGILTNGRHWRLYYQQARSRSEEFIEFDVAALAGIKGSQADLFSPESTNTAHYLRVFYLLFRRDAFQPQPRDRRSFHRIARDESRHWEARVSQDLGEAVFARIFPRLVTKLAQYDPDAPAPLDTAYLEDVRRAALILLYRLLFVFYAEDRNLLPVRDSRYDDYSLRRIREDIARRIDASDAFSASATRYYGHLHDLFAVIGRGDASIGMPPYNGGLFDNDEHPLLARTRLPDAVMATVIDGLSRQPQGQARLWINYRDLSVQHLGSVYERLLEYAVVTDDAGKIFIRANIYARKGSGSYYTHDDLVKLIIDETVGPLIAERVDAFRVRSDELAHKRTPKLERLRDLKPLDPAVNILDLKICDPAMGSGHFLVSLVDYLTYQVLERIADATEIVYWAEETRPYESPLVARVADIRARILTSAKANGWTIDPDQLDDRHIVRRMILKRVIYGVDKNPMAVELAKVALWLHSFTVGAPLSFLDHHLVTGDALYGERVRKVVDDLRRLGAMFHQQELTRIAVATDSMNRLSELTDVDIAEAHESHRLFQEIQAQLRPLNKLLDFWHALRWVAPVTSKAKLDNKYQRGLAELLSERLGNLMEVVSDGVKPGEHSETEDAQQAKQLLNAVRELTARESFLHWEVAFPTVWRGLEEGRPRGGFDAIIGNPPWDRMKLQHVEWFAARKPEIARAGRASDRKGMIARLQEHDDPWWRLYVAARDQAESAARVARECGEYPLLSRGDINIYSLFVERARSLVAPDGIVGLLTPSGIASDKGASVFFKAIAVGGHLAALLDFENKKVFFPDVHASFKFCVLVFGGKERRFAAARCAFFLHSMAELDDPERSFTLSAADFEAVNPNTGTAPIFRRQRDADITKTVYQRFPVLVDRRSNPAKQVWPVRYARMFDMTNDSGLFKRRDELEAEGFYPVEGNRWRKGKEQEYVPLYVGRMIRQYDHRAASVAVVKNNIHNQAISVETDPTLKGNPNCVTEPQYWVPSDVEQLNGKGTWVIGFRDIARTTDIRTVIAAIVPTLAAGNTLPLLLPSPPIKEFVDFAPLLLANLNSFACDYIARQKVQSTHVNWYILEQIPVLNREDFAREIGGLQIGDFIRNQVLRLTYTAIDMKPFARDMGFDGDPFVWDEGDRRQRVARLDALFFHLYGISRDDTAYILEQFPIVREQDEKTFGRYFTRDLILAYMNAIAAGDLDSIVRL